MSSYKPLVWAGTAALALVSLFLVAQTKQTLSTAATTNVVSFSGEGKVLAKPDVGIMDLSIVTEGATSKAAQDDNSKKSRSLTDYLKSQGVDEKDIKTTGYNIYPQYNYPPYSKPSISGYQVNQMVQVKVRDLDKIDDLLSGVVTAGVNQVNNLQLTVDEPDKLETEAREKAIADAKEKADDLEDQLGIRLGRIVDFSESADGVSGPIMMYADGRGGMGGEPTPSIPAGQNEIVVQVKITYQIK